VNNIPPLTCDDATLLLTHCVRNKRAQEAKGGGEKVKDSSV